jgi:hypothetical protein
MSAKHGTPFLLDYWPGLAWIALRDVRRGWGKIVVWDVDL